MKLLVVGSGGREHAIIKKLRENPLVTKIYALPGNGGIAADAECVDIKVEQTEDIVRFAVENGIDYAVVAPEGPLALGTVDRLAEAGVPAFGPSAAAAEIESSKVFSKNLMRKYNIPTAEYRVFTDMDKAIEYVETAAMPIVVKANGLALGKGVIIAYTREESMNAIRSMMLDKAFGESGSSVVIEQFLTGPEVTVLAFTDGETVAPMVSSMDHKRALDGDKGLNTGGMGTIAPNPFYTPEIAERCMNEIFLPTIRAMKEEGRPFKGCLYFGLMLTPDGPKVIEYNCRFGDPETQVVLPLMKSDLLTVMQATTNGTLKDTPVEFSTDHCCCVVMASQGYPEKYQSGYEITIPERFAEKVYVAGAKLEDGRLLSAGGRVLGVTARAQYLVDAIAGAYERVSEIHFANAYYRKDIGGHALAAQMKSKG